MKSILAMSLIFIASSPALANLNRVCVAQDSTKVEIMDRQVSQKIVINGKDAPITSVNDNGEIVSYTVNNAGISESVVVNMFTGEIVLRRASGDTPLNCQ